MKSKKKIGTITLELTLIFLGALGIIHQMGGMDVRDYMRFFLPGVLIVLGVEYLYYAGVYVKREEEEVKASGGAIIGLIFITVIGGGLFSFNMDLDPFGFSLPSNMYKYEAKRYFTFDTSLTQAEQIIADLRNVDIKIEKTNKKQISVTADMIIHSNILEEIPEDYVVLEEGGRLSIKQKKLNLEGSYNESGSVTIQIPENLLTTLNIRTSNAKINIDDIHAGGQLKSSNGNIVVKNTQGDLEAITSNASIELTFVKGKIYAKSSNGSIRLENEEDSMESVELRTSNASIEIIGAPKEDVELDLSTSNGRLQLPKEYAMQIQHEEDKNNLRETIGSGKYKVIAHTSNANIVIQSDR